MAFYEDGQRHDHPLEVASTFPINKNQAGNNGIVGFGTGGDITITAEDPIYKGYEGYYWSSATRGSFTNFASSQANATPNSPYDYGTYNKGPRSGRGGLSTSGWGSVSGKIFKIVKSGTSTSWGNGVYIRAHDSITHYKHSKTRFRAYFFVQSGPTNLQIGIMDSQATFSVGASQEWKYVDFVFGTSDVMDPDFLLSLGPTSGGATREVWMAFPTIEPVLRSTTAHDEGNGHDAQFIGVTNL